MPLRKGTRGVVACHLIFLLVVQDFIWAFPQVFESTTVQLSNSASLSSQQEFPWVSLTLYRGLDESAQGDRFLRVEDGPVLSMQAGDFDEDGVRDLITSVETAAGGLIRFHRGNLDALYPHSLGARERKFQGTFTDRPLFEPIESAALSFVPELMAVADLNGDGHLDVAAASIGGFRLHFLVGDGSGRLRLARSTELALPISHLLAEDVNRRDGITDLIVGLTGERSQIRVYEGPHGALAAQPEVLELEGPLSALSAGQLDDDPAIDIAAAAGSQLSLIRGRDRKLSIAGSAPQTVVDSYEFGFEIQQLVTGDFTGDNRYELAALAAEGEVQLISLLEADALPSTRLWRQPSPPPPGESSLASGSPSTGKLVAVRVSAFSKQDLILFEPDSARMAVLVEDGQHDRDNSGSAAASTSLEVTYLTSDELTAVLPMRLGPDALDDLVLATARDSELVFAQTTPNKTYTVNTNLAGTDFTTEDGVCDFDPPNNLCNWTSAVRSANGTPGLDKIDFDIDAVDPGTAFITDPVVVDGTSRGHVAFNGGISLTQVGNSTFRGLAFHGTSGRLQLRDFGDNIVEGNYFGTLDGLTAESAGGLVIVDSPRNQIGGTTDATRNLFGATGGTAIQISGEGAFDNDVEGNYVGMDATGTALIDGIGTGISIQGGAGNNTIGGTRNFVVGAVRGVYLTGSGSGNLIHGNYLGTDTSGSTALGNASGVEIQNSNDNTVRDNLISGNTGDGVVLSGTSNENLIQGNQIGVDGTGGAILANGGFGIDAGVVPSTFNNTIGGVGVAGNVISGNSGGGIRLTA